MMISAGDTSLIMDVVKEFGWEKFTIEQLETLQYALDTYLKMRNMMK